MGSTSFRCINPSRLLLLIALISNISITTTLGFQEFKGMSFYISKKCGKHRENAKESSTVKRQLFHTVNLSTENQQTS